MKLLLTICTSLMLCFQYNGFSQSAEEDGRLYVIELDTTNKYFVDELRLDVKPGDSIKFKIINGDFAIYIINAISFLSIKEPDLKVRINASSPESKIYEVKSVSARIENIYSVYCISKNSWPDAPPRIIVAVK